MNIQEILKECENLRIGEERCIENEYAELVIFSDELNHWRTILENFLGPATKPPGVKPSKNQKKIADEFGGIFENQTLFEKPFDNINVIAMFWPWQDGEHVTLKVAVLKN